MTVIFIASGSIQCVEELQLVHYQLEQKYEEHHDWYWVGSHVLKLRPDGVFRRSITTYNETRFVTLLFYLTDMVILCLLAMLILFICGYK